MLPSIDIVLVHDSVGHLCLFLPCRGDYPHPSTLMALSLHCPVVEAVMQLSALVNVCTGRDNSVPVVSVARVKAMKLKRVRAA